MKKTYLLLALLALPLAAPAAENLKINDVEAVVDTAQTVSFPVEIPAGMASDAELTIQALILDPKVRGHASVLKATWDGEPLTDCVNREKVFIMNDGRSIAAYSRGSWALAYGPSFVEIENASDNPYFVPALKEEITKLRFRLPNASPGSHVLEIEHSNDDIPQPLLIGSITLGEQKP